MPKTTIGYTHPPEHIARREGVCGALQSVKEIIGQAYVHHKSYEKRMIYVERQVLAMIKANPPLQN